MCLWFMAGAQGGQKSASNSLEREFQRIVDHRVGAGNQIRILCKSIEYCHLLSISPSLLHTIFNDFKRI